MHVRSLRRTGLAGLLVLAAGPAIAAASPYGRDPAATATQSGPESAIVSASLTLVIGGLALALSESYTEGVTDKARAEPGRSFLVGFLALLAVIGFLLLAIVTRILLVLAIPLLIAFFVVAVVGNVMGHLAVGRSLTNGWAGALLVAVIAAAFTGGVPVIGTFVGFVVGSIGVGAVLNRWRDGDAKSQFQSSGVTPGPDRNW